MLNLVDTARKCLYFIGSTSPLFFLVICLLKKASCLFYSVFQIWDFAHSICMVLFTCSKAPLHIKSYAKSQNTKKDEKPNCSG